LRPEICAIAGNLAFIFRPSVMKAMIAAIEADDTAFVATT